MYLPTDTYIGTRIPICLFLNALRSEGANIALQIFTRCPFLSSFTYQFDEIGIGHSKRPPATLSERIITSRVLNYKFEFRRRNETTKLKR